MTGSSLSYMSASRVLPAAACTAILALLIVAWPAPGQGRASRCHAEISRAVLPVWARAGFSDPRPRIPHVLGHSGQIVAVVFGYPLRSPPAPRRNNKILWVSRTRPQTSAALWIRAQRMAGERSVGAPVRRIVAGGPGPSLVDVPEPGCWRVTLRWSGRVDTLDLAYGTGN